MPIRLTHFLTCCALLLPCVPAAAQQRTAGPFTHAPRSVRSRSIDQQHVKLELKFDWNKEEMQGFATHTLMLLAPASSIELDAAEMTIKEVTLIPEPKAGSAIKVKSQHQGQKLTIQLDKEYPAG